MRCAARFTCGFALAFWLGVLFWLGVASLAPAQFGFTTSPTTPAVSYEAWLADGTRIEGTRLLGWFKGTSDEPYLGGQVLKLHGNPPNPLRLLRQVAAPAPRLTPPYIELTNGDILPGRILSAEASGSDPDDIRLHVSIDASLAASSVATGRMAIRAGWVARVVGSPRAVAPAPANVALGLDGEQLAYRSFRWMPEGVRLLTDQGVQLVSYGSLGQIAPAGADRLAALLGEAAQANAEGAPFLMRVVTRQGAVLTSHRTEREVVRRAYARGRETRTPDVEIEYLQPAWALGAFSLPPGDVVLRGFRTPHDIPLSLLPLEVVEQRSLVGVVQQGLSNAVPRGGWLTAGERVADLGLAARSRTVLRATLPPGAKTFSGWVGLDRSVGPGGCIEASIYEGVPSGTALWSSGFLQGKDGPRRIDPLPLDDAAHLALVTDFGHEGRPAGADPLDIRDEAVWLAPIVAVDDHLLELPQRWRGVVPGWQGWTLPEEMPRELLLASRFMPSEGRWETVLTVGEDSPLVLKRRIQVAAYSNDILELLVASLVYSGYREPVGMHRCELRVDGTLIPVVVNNERLRVTAESQRMQLMRRGGRLDLMGTLAVWWDLQDYRGREVELQLTVGRPESGEMLWRDLRLRGAVAALRSGMPATPDVPLSALQPVGGPLTPERGDPTPNILPGRGGPLTLLGQRFRSGYGMSRESSITFPVRPEFKRFVALVGSAEHLAGPFKVLLDGEPAWTHPTLDSTSPAREVVIEIPPGTQRLTLETGPDGSYRGYTVWANAGFVTK